MGKVRKADGDAMRSHVSNVKGASDGKAAQSAVSATSTRNVRKPRTSARAYLKPDEVRQPPAGYVALVHTDSRGRITRVDYVRA
jgi:hypothetical protein